MIKKQQNPWKIATLFLLSIMTIQLVIAGTTYIDDKVAIIGGGDGNVTADWFFGLMDWTNLSGVPAGFADGIDNTGGSPDPNSTTLAWDNITSIPAGFADGTDDIGVGNVSWNQSFANTLYTPIQWNYNQTTPAQDYADATFLTLADQRYNETLRIDAINTTANIETIQNSSWDFLTNVPAGFADGTDDVGSGGNASWNESYANTLYTPILWNYNQTTPATDYGDATFLTLADQRYNETTTLNSVNTTANIEALNFVQGAHTVLSNLFNQDLNTTNSVQFLNISIAEGSNSSIGAYRTIDNGTCRNTYKGATLIESIGCS